MWHCTYRRDQVIITAQQLVQDPVLGRLDQDVYRKGLVEDTKISVADLARTYGLRTAFRAAGCSSDYTHVWDSIALWLADTAMGAIRGHESEGALIGAHLIMRRYTAPRDDLRVFRDAAVQAARNADYEKRPSALAVAYALECLCADDLTLRADYLVEAYSETRNTCPGLHLLEHAIYHTFTYGVPPRSGAVYSNIVASPEEEAAMKDWAIAYAAANNS